MNLNKEQKDLIETEPNGHMLIKGVAGSGKTTVTVKRAEFLLNNYCHNPEDKVLLITYNKNLLSYIKYLYEKVDGSDDFNKLNNTNIEIINIDSLTYRYFMKYNKSNNRNLRINKKRFRDALTDAIFEMKKKYPDESILDNNKNFLLEEIGWIKSCNILDLDTYMNVDRRGRGNTATGPDKLRKDSKTRRCIYELLMKYDEILLNSGTVDFETMNQMALEYVKNNDCKKYTHILIDESQDLTKVKLLFLKYIYTDKVYSSITFAADNTQGIYVNSWLGKGNPYSSIGYDMSGRSKILSKNYRTTTEISRAAFSLVENDQIIKNNSEYIEPSLIDKYGQYPVYKNFIDIDEQLRFLSREIMKLSEMYDLSNICIIARETRMLYNVRRYLEDNGIAAEIMYSNKNNFENNKVKLTTMHSIKGLEFDVVFLINLNEDIIPSIKSFNGIDDDDLMSNERRLMYVGMTRAKELLYLLSYEEESEFIFDIEREYLRMDRNIRMRPHRLIAIEDYRFIDDINDIYSKEESVRQWLIDELINSYEYLERDIKLEYPVQMFSKNGRVDIVVMKDEEAFIFIETKKRGTDLEIGLSQLKSYMQAEKCKYGIVTDGINITIIDDEGKELDDIPKAESYIKEDIDIAKEQDIEIVKIPLLGDVAAGNLKYAEEYNEELLDFPKDKIKNPEKSFILKVTGDSMIDKGIDTGDYVLVEKQSVADEGDIVIAVVNEDATMKEYRTIGHSILLMPANNEYEPIVMDANNVIINGVVKAYIKNSEFIYL